MSFLSFFLEEGWQLLGAGNASRTQEDTQNGTHDKVCEEDYLEKE